jgi:thioredoxin 1
VGRVLHLTDDNFEQEVLEAKMPVLVDFSASWCTPCRIPVIPNLAVKYGFRVGQLDVGKNPRIATHYHIRSVPTFMVFAAGEVQRRWTGIQSKAWIENLLRRVGPAGHPLEEDSQAAASGRVSALDHSTERR